MNKVIQKKEDLLNQEHKIQSHLKMLVLDP